MRRCLAAVGVAALLLVLAPAAVLPAAAQDSGGWSVPGSGVTPVTGTLNGGGQIVGPSPAPGAVRPTGVVRTRGRSIEISLRAQKLTAWQDGRIVKQFLVSTGRPGYRTPAGRFRIRAKGTNWWSRKWRVWMPMAMNFYSNYNLHSLPHYPGGRLIGASSLGRAASHGCVRIGPSNARWLYSWAPVGTPVWIH